MNDSVHSRSTVNTYQWQAANYNRDRFSWIGISGKLEKRRRLEFSMLYLILWLTHSNSYIGPRAMPEKHGCPNHALNLITFIHKDQTRPDQTVLTTNDSFDQLVHLHRSWFVLHRFTNTIIPHNQDKRSVCIYINARASQLVTAISSQLYSELIPSWSQQSQIYFIVYN